MHQAVGMGDSVTRAFYQRTGAEKNITREYTTNPARRIPP